MSEIWLTLLGVLVVSSVSLLGIIFLSLHDGWLRRLLPLLVAVAVGALLGDALIHLVPESFEEVSSPVVASLLVIFGILFFFILEQKLHWHHHGEDSSDEHIHPAGKLLLLSDAGHNFIDGVIVAASFLVSPAAGWATVVAVMLHEIPQELGDFAVLIHSGYTKTRALWLNFVSALTAFLGVAVFYLFQSFASGLALYAVPFAAGGFIYIAMTDLIPELHRARHVQKIALSQVMAILLGVVLMLLLIFVE